MATQLKPRPTPADEEAPPTIIVKKIIAGHEEEHHNSGWKVAYADFATAMMAFFMLLWIIGATTEKQRQGIADYFSPTLVKLNNESSGSNGLLQGRSARESVGGAPGSASSIVPSITKPGGEGDADNAVQRAAQAVDRANFRKVEAELSRRLAADPSLSKLREQVRFVQTREGLRIEIIDQAGFSMFELGTATLVAQAQELMREVARSVATMPNAIAVRGHTDGLQYAGTTGMNNWHLSAQRAETTRQTFVQSGVADARFSRIEGVADREPSYPQDLADPRNRRISVTLFYQGLAPEVPPPAKAPERRRPE